MNHRNLHGRIGKLEVLVKARTPKPAPVQDDTSWYQLFEPAYYGELIAGIYAMFEKQGYSPREIRGMYGIGEGEGEPIPAHIEAWTDTPEYRNTLWQVFSQNLHWKGYSEAQITNAAIIMTAPPHVFDVWEQEHEPCPI